MSKTKGVEALKSEGVELFEYDLIGTKCTFRLPVALEGDVFLSRFSATVDKGERPFMGQAARTLVTQCVVSPDPATVQGLLDKRPGAAIPFANEIFGIYSGEAEAKAKKL